MSRLLTALALAALPLAALAQEPRCGREHATLCPEGQVFNPDTKVCDPIPSS